MMKPPTVFLALFLSLTKTNSTIASCRLAILLPLSWFLLSRNKIQSLGQLFHPHTTKTKNVERRKLGVRGNKHPPRRHVARVFVCGHVFRNPDTDGGGCKFEKEKRKVKETMHGPGHMGCHVGIHLHLDESNAFPSPAGGW